MTVLKVLILKSRSLLLTIILFVAACSQAPEQDGGNVAFDKMDANQDRVISAEEWDAFSDAVFDEIDRDGDGQASPAELSMAFDTFDHNEDGVITYDEAPLVVILYQAEDDSPLGPDDYADINWTRQSIDTNGDGLISKNEFRDARQRVFTNADRDRDRRLRFNEIDDASRIRLLRF